uniref:RING-type domain-containing protein n=1 Tax=Rhabditophanes sp. KR3021 TaxID=114890 RepID=A0AC35TPC8_9BILA
MSMPPDSMFVENLSNYFQARSLVDNRVAKKYNTEQAVKLLLELNLTQNKFELLLKNLHGTHIFPSFYSVKKMLKQEATGDYEYITKLVSAEPQDELIHGCCAKDVESILKERISSLLAAENLVFCKEISYDGQETYYINFCISGDSGQGSSKFNIQPQLITSNHSSLALTVIAFWFGKDTRNLMEYFLEKPLEEIDRIKKDGFEMKIDKKIVKVRLHFYFTADFMCIYNFFGLKGQCSKYFCYLCKLESGSQKTSCTVPN